MRAVALVLCVVALAGCGRQGGPAAAQRLQWNHAELFAHLRGEGLQFREGRRGTDEGRPFVSIWFDDNPTVRVSLQESEQAARDRAGVEGERAAYWGRFLFVGPPADVRKIRAALP